MGHMFKSQHGHLKTIEMCFEINVFNVQLHGLGCTRKGDTTTPIYNGRYVSIHTETL